MSNGKWITKKVERQDKIHTDPNKQAAKILIKGSDLTCKLPQLPTTLNYNNTSLLINLTKAIPPTDPPQGPARPPPPLSGSNPLKPPKPPSKGGGRS